MKVKIRDVDVGRDFSGAKRRISVSFDFGSIDNVAKIVKGASKKIFTSKRYRNVQAPSSFSTLYVSLNRDDKRIKDKQRVIIKWIRYFIRQCVNVLVNDVDRLFSLDGKQSYTIHVANGGTFHWEALTEDYLKVKESKGMSLDHKVFTGELESSFDYEVVYARGGNDISFSVGFYGLGEDVYRKIIVHEFSTSEKMPKRPLIIPINNGANYILDLLKNAVQDFVKSDKISSGEYFFRMVLPKYIPERIIWAA